MGEYSYLGPIISGILSGGATALTAFSAAFGDIKKRLATLETQCMIMAKGLEQIEEKHDRLEREINDWESAPPEWATRRRATSFTFEQQREFEERVDNKMRNLMDRVRQAEEQLADYRTRLKDCLPKSEYEDDSRFRSDELDQIRTNLSAANGFLRGVMAALGYLDPPDEPPTFRRR